MPTISKSNTKNVKLPTLPQLKRWMTELAAENDLEKQVENTWKHSTVVWSIANEIVTKALKQGYAIDRPLVRIGCFAHDMGRMVTGSKGSREKAPAIQHFYEGYRFFMKKGYTTLARICVSHAGGGGLDKKTNKQAGFMYRDFFPRSPEEKIIAYADALTTFNPRKGPHRGSYDEAYKRFSLYPGHGARLTATRHYIHSITNDSTV